MASVGGVTLGFSAETGGFVANVKKATTALATYEAQNQKVVAAAGKFGFAIGTGIGNSINLAKSAISTLIPSVGILGGGLAVAFSAGIKASAEWADNLTELADRANVSAGVIQELQFAGIKFGVGTEAINKGLETVNTRLGQFVTDGGGPAADTFARLGIAAKITSGELRTTEDVALASLDAISGLGTQAERAAASAALFGKASGPQLAALTSQGAKALASAREEAKALGFVLDDTRLNSVGAINDAFEGLTTVIGRQFTGAVAGAAPAIVGFTATVAAQIPTLLSYIQTVLEALGAIERTQIRTAQIARQAAVDNLAGLYRERNVAKANGRAATISPYNYGPAASGRLGADGLDATGIAVAEAEVRRTATAAALLEGAQRRALASVGTNRPPPLRLGGASAGRSRGGGGGSGTAKINPLIGDVTALFDRLASTNDKAVNQFAASGIILDKALASNIISLDGYREAQRRLNEELANGAGKDLIKSKDLPALVLPPPVTVDFTRGLKAANDAVKAFEDEQAARNDRFTQIGESLGARVVDGILAGDFKGVARGFFESLTQAFLDELIGKPFAAIGKDIGLQLAGAIGGGSSSGSAGGGLVSAGLKIVSSLFGGGKASGGAVSGSKYYLVGENGPELFAPGVNGNITPNHALRGATPRGGNQTVQITVNAQGAVLSNQLRQEMAAAVAGSIPINSNVARSDARRQQRNRLAA